MANYWIFQANPRTYFIADYYLEDYVKRNKDVEDWWGVEDRFEGEFNRGDIAYVWKCAQEPLKKHAPDYHSWKAATGWTNRGSGIYAVARVLSQERDDEITEADIERFKKYYADWSKALGKQLRVHFYYYANRASNPLLSDDIPLERILPRVWKRFARPGAGQGKLAFKLTLEEGRLLWQLIFGSGSPPLL